MKSLKLSKVLVFSFVAAVAAVAVLAPALAQAPPTRNEFLQLLNRLQALEDSMGQVRRQSGLPEAQRPQPGPLVAPAPSTDRLLERQDAMRSEIDAQIRDATGAIERLGFEVDKLSKRVEKLIKDMDVRLVDLERTATAGGGQSSAPQRGPQAGAPETTLQAARQPVLPDGTPEQQYNYAYGLLRQLDFERAELSLRAFLDRHPNHGLAENGRYLLGETYFARKKYEAAAETFLDGYRRNKDGRKAPDNLLKLGISLAQLGQKSEACTTFRELVQRFGASAREIKDQAVAEQKKSGCPS